MPKVQPKFATRSSDQTRRRIAVTASHLIALIVGRIESSHTDCALLNTIFSLVRVPDFPNCELQGTQTYVWRRVVCMYGRRKEMFIAVCVCCRVDMRSYCVLCAHCSLINLLLLPMQFSFILPEYRFSDNRGASPKPSQQSEACRSFLMPGPTHYFPVPLVKSCPM